MSTATAPALTEYKLSRCGSRRKRSSVLVLAVGRYDDLSEAIGRANATSFGLAAGIWTRTSKSSTASTARCGRDGLGNEWLAMFPETPHGGYGMSGIGREMGPEALHEFQENKTVIQKTGPGS